jgi:hypothetical protein
LISAMMLAGVSGEAVAQRPDGPPGPRREALERQLRERTAQVVQRRLGLDDEQMRRLQATNRQFQEQRMALFARERDARQALRREMAADDQANQSRVAQLLDQTLLLERQRLDLLQAEQRELAKFLTPVQRAKLLGIQTELRRRTQDMRRR